MEKPMNYDDFTSDATAMPPWGERRRMRDGERKKAIGKDLCSDQRSEEEWTALEQALQYPAEDRPSAPSASA